MVDGAHTRCGPRSLRAVRACTSFLFSIIGGTMRGIEAAAIRVGLICASLLAAGCFANRQAYPQAWPSIKTSVGQTCAEIANTYRDSGESATTLSGRTSA